MVVELDGKPQLVAETQEHLDRRTVRGVAMENTAGLRRGSRAGQTGGPIRVPVGEKVLGRLINVLGSPIDRLGAFQPDIDALADSSSIAVYQSSGSYSARSFIPASK